MNKTDESLPLHLSQALQKPQRMKAIGLPLVVFFCFLAAWWFTCKFNIFPSYAMPSPMDVANSFKEEIVAGRLVNDIVASLWRVFIGFFLAE